MSSGSMNPPNLLRRLWRRPSGTHLAVAGAVAFAIAFPDLALMLLGQAAHVVWFILHTVIGVFELGTEHVIEWAFHVPRHTAQIMTAWVGILAFLLLLVWLARKFVPSLRTPPPESASQDHQKADKP